MIAAAAALFAHAGFHGVTTKDIAHHAKVSEGNIFRYFPSKRDLFVAAIDSELAKLALQANVSGPPADDVDSQTALRMLFETIARKVLSKPELVRLLQFSALEFGAEMEPVYRKHLDKIVNASTRTLTQWCESYGFRDISARVAVFGFVATMFLLQSYPIISSSILPFPSTESAAAEYAELWYRALTNETEMAGADAGTAHEDVLER